MPQFSADTVVQRAQTLTDVEDPDPTHFAENLAAVVECMSGEKELTLAGVEMAVGMLALALRNRMEVDRYVADQPAVENASVDRPIFLTGLPRSGTTYFQYLFDLDPDLRMMRTWEGERPVPPPAVDADSARRRREASIENARLDSRTNGREDRRLPSHGRRRPAGVSGDSGPDVCQPGTSLANVGGALLGVPATRG